MKRAFTLIELLVVIAIIAILAAILFPVFAQAKQAAKKTQTLSNTKQSGLSILMYGGDSDDTFPLSMAIDTGVTTGACAGGTAGTYYMSNWVSTTPAGADDAGCGTIDSTVWINSTQPYRKSYAVTTQAGATQLDTYDAKTLAAFIKAPEISSLSMNGLLNSFSGTAVASPSKNPLVWPGSYFYNWRGAAELTSNPYLNCSSTGPCVFNASSPPQANTGWDGTGRGDAFYTFTNLNSSLWMYGKGFSYCSVDGSAHFVNQGTGGSYNGPALSTDAKGVLAVTLRCSTVAGLANGFYSSWFRPDSTYSYPTGTNRQACGF